MTSLRLAVALLAGVSAPAYAQSAAPAAVPKIAVPAIAHSQRTLANGVRVIAARDPKAANVSVYVWYDVGQRDDPVGRGGFAHLFEHLMFKTTRNLPQGVQPYMTEIGVRGNASTLFDYTIYNMTGPADQLERMLWLEGERLQNLVIDDAAFQSERNVVKEELRQRIFAQPYGRILYTLIPGFVFTTHPYARPIGGTAADLDQASLADVRAFHEAYYRPDNMVVVVAGNFDAAALDRWADKYLGAMPRPSRPMPRDKRDEPMRETPRTIDAYAPNVPLPALVYAWRAPPAADRDHAALAVIEAYLVSGPAARLNRTLVAERKLASSVIAYNLPARDGYGFTLFATLAAGAKLPDAEAALAAEMARLRNAPIAAEELDRVRNGLLGDALAGRETTDRRANTLGDGAILTGDPAMQDHELAAIRALTPADIQRVARKWLSAERLTAIRYQDESARPAGYAGDRSPNKVAEMGTSVPPAARPAVAIADAADRIAPPPEGTKLKRAAPAIVERTLANGMRLVTARSTAVPLATIELVIGGGDASDPAGREGLTDLTAALVLRGAGSNDAAGFASAIDRLGGSISASALPDAVTIRVTVPSVNAEAAGRLLADAVRRPRLEPGELDNERRKQGSALAVALKQPMQIGLRRLNQVVLAGTAYGAVPTPQSLAAITLDDVKAVQTKWGPARATLIVTGSLDAAQAEAMAQRLFGDWQGGVAEPRPAPIPAAPAPRIVAVDLPGAGQAAVLAGYRLPPRSDAGFRGIELGASAIGGGSQSWLNQEIRVKRGLSYGAGTELQMRERTGFLLGATQTKNESAVQVVDLMLAQFARLGNEMPTADKLDERMRFLANGRGAQTERTVGLAEYLASLVITRTPLTVAGEELTGPISVSDDRLRAAAALLDPKAASVVIVGDSKQWIEALRAKYPSVELVEASAP